MEKYVLAFDQGTTSSRSLVFDKKGNIISVAQKEFKQYFPHPGWVEHDPEEIYSSQMKVASEAMKKHELKNTDIASVGITNQRETTIVWDKKTGKVIYNAIVWQDRRTARFCDELKKEGNSDLIRSKTGLVIDAYFSATKIKWILDNVDGARKRAENGELAFGTVDSWLVWKLTDGKLHITDVTNASRTLLFNINLMAWDDELLKLFNIPKSMLPEVKESSEAYGNITASNDLRQIPIAGIAGDQHAALFGQMCTKPGMVKNTYGTGCFMLMNIGDKPILSKNNLVTTVAWKINNKVQYALEGSVFIAGAAVQWLRDSLKIIKTSGEIENLASTVESSDGVYFVPAFTGLGAPHWNQHAQGTIFGLTRGSTDAHIARAALESIAYQTMDVLNAMISDSGISVNELRVDGGATVNNLLMQFQADVLNTDTIRPMVIETTAMGAAFLAGLAINYWQSVDKLEEMWQIEKRFSPKANNETISQGIKGWNRAIESLKYWTNI